MSTQADPTDRCVELSLDAALLHVADHVGVFYRGAAERDAFMLPLVCSALGAGCGVVYVCDRDPRRVAAQLAGASLTVGEALDGRQLRILATDDVYLPDGRFEPDRTVGFYQAEVAAGGHPVTCVVGEMSWSLRGCPGTERLLEYEARCTEVIDSAPTIALCLYDLERTRGEHLFDLLRLHNRVVLNGIEMRNPCVDPGSLLEPGQAQPGIAQPTVARH